MTNFHRLFLALLLGIWALPLRSQCYELIWAEAFDSTGLQEPTC